MGRIAITGGLGHIGSSFLHDYAALQDWGEVVVVDNFLTNRYCTLFDLPRPILFYERDITSHDLAPIFAGSDAVLHLAAIVNAGDTFDKEGATQETNAFGVGRVVRAAEEAGVRTFIYVSTASVYGPGYGIRDESTTDLHPQSPYAQFKLDGESYVLDSSIPHAYVIRAGTIFGYSRGMRFHTVTNKFILRAVTKQSITIWKPGTGARPYLSLHDLKNCVLSILQSLPPSGIYNAATWHWTPVEIVEEIQKFVPDLSVEYVVPRILNQDGYHISTKKAEEARLLIQERQPAHEELRDYIRSMVHGVLQGIAM